MFGSVKQIFVSAMMFFGCNLLSVNPLECVSKSNQECNVGPDTINKQQWTFILSLQC